MSNGIHLSNKSILIILLLALAVIVAAYVLASRGCSNDQENLPARASLQERSAEGPAVPIGPQNFGSSVTSGYDLFLVLGGSAYQDFGSGCQGLICGDWGEYRDSLSYQCFVAVKDTDFVWFDSTGLHYFPGLVTVVTFYEGKPFLYASKTTFDWGSTNCLLGVSKRSLPDPPYMMITEGCGDVYYPKVWVGSFAQGDKIVIMPVIDKDKRLKESNRSNNWGFLPLRKDTSYFDPTQGVKPGWVFDTTALTNKNRAAIRLWLRKNFTP
jgi:hypothetical protein